MIWNWLRRHPPLVDTGLVALLLLVTITVATHHNRPTAGVVLGVAETLPLLWRPRRRVAGLGIAVARPLRVIASRGGAADDVFEVDPARVREPIRAIETAARSALGDLRRVLGVLQNERGVHPQPGLATLDTLVEQVRATGLA